MKQHKTIEKLLQEFNEHVERMKLELDRELSTHNTGDASDTEYMLHKRCVAFSAALGIDKSAIETIKSIFRKQVAYIEPNKKQQNAPIHRDTYYLDWLDEHAKSIKYIRSPRGNSIVLKTEHTVTTYPLSSERYSIRELIDLAVRHLRTMQKKDMIPK